MNEIQWQNEEDDVAEFFNILGRIIAFIVLISLGVWAFMPFWNWLIYI